MKKILLVDDEPDVVRLVGARLKVNGYEVMPSTSGAQALEMVKQNTPDLIILDVMMPPPNGFQVCRALKDDPKYKKIPIILLTAKTTDSDKFMGMESGADDYITKPYDPEDLLAKVKVLLRI